MSQPHVDPVPQGFRAVTPHLVCKDAAAAIDFYQAAFGINEVSRLSGPDGSLMHAILEIGDSKIFLVDENPQCGHAGPKVLGGSPVTIHLYVPDADATVAQAVASGAEVTMPLWDAPWGDRYCQLKDPFGHNWSVATHQRDVSPEQVKADLLAMMAGA